MDLRLDSPAQFIPRVGPRMATLLKKLGVETVYDLLTYVPFRYNDFSHVSAARGVRPGETVTIVGTLDYIRTFRTKNGRQIVSARLHDDSGTIDIAWFNQMYLLKVLAAGDIVSVSGKVDWFGQKIMMTSPAYEVLSAASDGVHSLHTGRLVPIYPETAGLSSKWLRGRIAYLLTVVLDQVIDRLPQHIRTSEGLMDLSTAISTIHYPQTIEDANSARRRLAFDELLFHVLRSHEQKRQWKTQLTAQKISLPTTDFLAFVSSLPFTLTRDQEVAIGEILTDMQNPVPMNRLLEGDVGAGKTVVAAAGMFAAYKNGKSSVLMAPTQILATQHAATLVEILEKPHGIPVHLILGGKQKSLPQSTKTPVVYVGTHALLSTPDTQKNIALTIIDEQQRFGVGQRSKLRNIKKGKKTPHLLTMTATPIPRTIAQVTFGNLDLSVLLTMPSGRSPVKTWLVPNEKRESAYTWIEKQIKDTQSQAFIICPFIEESESMKTVKAATGEFERIKKKLPNLRIELLHGRMKSDEKTAILSSMSRGEMDILIATPIVEVGIDIPNATVMVIEAAERFGLSQLHQLRGRVGRRDKPSFCLLFTEADTEVALARLRALESTHSGPKLAELDLALRGPGELFGTRQHGLPGFALASLTDTELLGHVQSVATSLTQTDPELLAFPHLREIVQESTIEAIQS